MRPIEGWAVRDKRGIFYYVLGVEQPREALWVYPKYVPSDRGDRIILGKGYRKLKSYSESMRWALEKIPEHVKMFNNRLLLVSLPWNMMLEMYSPKRRLFEVIERGAVYKIEEAAASLAMAISSISGVYVELFGISGSLLIGALGRDSDINVVCYPRPDEVERIYFAVARLRSMGVTRPIPDKYLEAEYRATPKKERGPWRVFRGVEVRKLLRGVFHGFKYTVKICLLYTSPSPRDRG